MAIKAFIIDDEAPARRELKYLLEQIEGVDIVGEAPNGTLGLKGIRETKPQVVFLDVQMPGLNGLEVSEFLCELPDKPLIIFATAFEEYATKAFDVEAFDYILKPFSIERVKKAIKKSEKFLHEDSLHISLLKEAAVLKTPDLRKEAGVATKKIPLYKDEKIIPTSPQKILSIKCLDGEISVQTMEGRYKTKSTLNELESKLSPYGFIRTHRSVLVNMNHVLEVIPWFNGSYKVIMNDKEKTEILVSRNYVKDLKKHFDL